MKNLLSLHESIVIALININKDTFTASFDEIATYIEKEIYIQNEKEELI